MQWRFYRKLRIILLLMILLAGVYLVMITKAQRRADSLTCASSITSICLSAHIWADEHNGMMPTNFLCMSNELSTPKILSCVSARRAKGGWADFKSENCTYEILTPGMDVDNTNTAFLRCTIHGFLGYSDSTVFDGVRRRNKFE
jgi:hypothetical protein